MKRYIRSTTDYYEYHIQEYKGSDVLVGIPYTTSRFSDALNYIENHPKSDGGYYIVEKVHFDEHDEYLGSQEITERLTK